MKEAVEYCKKNYPDIKLVVGGAPVSKSFASEINADAYGEDATSVMSLFKCRVKTVQFGPCILSCELPIHLGTLR